MPSGNVPPMNRDDMLGRLRTETTPWDVLVIGGGATGLGCALDAAARGLRTALVERGDFAHGTSSRSTKLAHGGVRYLRAGQFSLVAQSLRERERLRRNAAGIVHPAPFVVPAYRFYERAFYGAGLLLYGLLSPAGDETRVLSRADTIARLPGLHRDGLRGGVLYHDGQFDDARLALALARSAARHGAAVVNHVCVDGIARSGARVSGVIAHDVETGAAFEIGARVVINAAGIGVDAVRRMDDPAATAMVRTSRGTHIVLDESFSPGGTAILVPNTEDGRVLFVIPWRGRLLVGTTDTPSNVTNDEPVAAGDDVDYLLRHAARYLATAPQPADIRSVYAGLRPLLAGSGSTASLRRDHRVVVSPGGLVTITGGKWTTYRLMAEHAVDRACAVARLSAPASTTPRLALDIPPENAARDPLEARAMAETDDGGGTDAALDAFVRDAVRNDMARTIEDVLARRSRALLLDARGAARLAPRVAAVLAREFGRDNDWQREQIREFEKTAARYLPPHADQ
ncbi:MAG TPA: glycerol-3-phosphate dehydrogenase/oxidase [Candidatus Krumholzibacteria bacterium]|nr:glycerol-3-phosphate dehydrogenase/oxidase [Candidatus Krumholzibacteria bacterium]